MKDDSHLLEDGHKATLLTTEPSSRGQDLFSFLTGVVEDMEGATGHVDVELRSKIEALKVETRRLPDPSSFQMNETDASSICTEQLELASRLDQLEQRLVSLDRKISTVTSDALVTDILKDSSDLWLPVITADAQQRRSNFAGGSSHP
eukprot:SM000070S21344  [mRNA]  locus=s70:657907:658829:+ [translate_table: standard]